MAAFTFLVLTLLVCSSSPWVDAKDAIQGYYHAWWAIIPLPKTTVQKMLPAGRSMALADVSLPGLGADQHPVVLEIGTEHNAGPIGIPTWLLPTFPEFKLDIPYLIASAPSSDSATTNLNYKSIIYTDSSILNAASRLQYNLNASKADMKQTDNSYTVNFDGHTFTANFESSGSYQSPDKFPNFSTYNHIMSQTWFGSYQRDRKTCADHHYQFDTIQVRPASMTVQAAKGVLDVHFPEGQIKTPDLTKALGTVEVLAHFTITQPYDCLPN
ncbi:uncharacterized protein LOC119720966 [Patiria miniata]|uniref:Uncharacterized protein n=1 Tax=Patiria miniata TaxID=46514 RepID=A0A913Z4R8_PATMI|nr:uncharacterized protein LOC119720966 [Patiria miniata]